MSTVVLLNINMETTYYSVFYDVVKDTQSTTGTDLPHDVEAYVVGLLSSFVKRNDIPPESAIAEMFLKIKTTNQAKQLGDTCLFVSGVFPNFKKRAGINRRYFQDIGATSYEIARPINTELFPTISQHFVFLSEFIETAVDSSTHIQQHFKY